MLSLKLSVIIPIYNCEKLIHKLLDSLLSSNISFEIICVNDGSTDNTLEVLEQYNDNRLKIYSKENAGTFKAWQYGLSKANGEYVTIMDQDDNIDSNYISFINEFIKTINADVLFTPYYIEKESGEKKIVNIPIHEGLYRGENIERIRNRLCDGSVPYAKFSKVIRKQVLDEQVKNTYEGTITDFEDWLTIIEVFSKIKSLCIVNRPFYHYIQYSNTNSVSKSTKSYRKNYDSMKAMISFLSKSNYSRLSDDTVESIYFYASRIILNKCIKIKELSLADEILNDQKFKQYVFKSNLKLYEKMLLKNSNALLIYYLYVIKKKVSH